MLDMQTVHSPAAAYGTYCLKNQRTNQLAITVHRNDPRT